MVKFLMIICLGIALAWFVLYFFVLTPTTYPDRSNEPALSKPLLGTESIYWEEWCKANPDECKG